MARNNVIAGREVIDRHLPHGDYWPSGEPTGIQVPDQIIVHAMAYQIDYHGERLYAATFLDRIGLSAHILCTHHGKLIRCRHDDEIAWHAKGFNRNSLGIEILVPQVYDYGSFLQRIQEPWIRPDGESFRAAADVVAHWIRVWGIDPDRVRRHSDVDPERKRDPGRGFPWDEFLATVQSRLH